MFSSIINTLHIVCLTHPIALFKTRPSWKHHCQSFLFFERSNAFLIGPSTRPEAVRHGPPPLIAISFCVLDGEMPPRAQSVFWISGLGQNFNKRNLVNNYNTLLYICGNLNLHKNKYLNLVTLNELCFCRTLCPLKLWTPWRTTSRVLKAIKLTQVAKLNCRGSYLHTKVWK